MLMALGRFRPHDGLLLLGPGSDAPAEEIFTATKWWLMIGASSPCLVSIRTR